MYEEFDMFASLRKLFASVVHCVSFFSGLSTNLCSAVVRELILKDMLLTYMCNIAGFARRELHICLTAALGKYVIRQPRWSVCHRPDMNQKSTWPQNARPKLRKNAAM